MDFKRIFPLYSPDRIGTLYESRYEKVEQAADAHGAKTGLGPVTYVANSKIVLLCFGFQSDLISQAGVSLPHAKGVTQRTTEFILRNLQTIDRIFVFRECHSRFQVFFPSWWTCPASGKSPKPGDVILPKDVKSGKWVPVREADWTRDYLVSRKGGCEILPYHCLVGMPGAALDQCFAEVLHFYAALRSEPTLVMNRGAGAKCEDYSVFDSGDAPVDVEQSEISRGALLEGLSQAETIYVAGYPWSLRVIPSLFNMFDMFVDPTHTPKTVIVGDCVCEAQLKSSDSDRKQADVMMKKLAKNGIRKCFSTDSISVG